MKSFKFRYSIAVWVLLAFVLLLSIISFAWNVFNVIHFKGTEQVKIISYYVIAIITAGLSVFVICVMAYGRYVIKNGKLYTCFGFIKFKIDVKDIVGVTHFKKSNKLVAYFSSQEYSVIVISLDDYDKFVLSVREINPSIVFDAQIDGEDTPS